MLVDAHTHRSSPHPHVRVLSAGEVLQGRAPEGAFCAGVHPWDAEEVGEDVLPRLAELLRHPGCAAVGEAGLDRARRVNWARQEAWFMRQWDLAEEHQLPLVLHVVRASSDLMAFLKRRRPRTPWLWHGFSGPVAILPSLLKFQPACYFSFGPANLRQRQFRQLWSAVPQDRRLLETDDSGADLREVYLQVAADEVQLTHNFFRLFERLAVSASSGLA